MTKVGEKSFRTLILAENRGCRVVGCRLQAHEAHHIIYKSKWSAEIEKRIGATRDSLSNGIGLCAEHHYKAHNGLGLRCISGRQFMFYELKKLIESKDSYFDRWSKVLWELEKSLMLKGVIEC